jgi:hypothetical protein
MKNAVRIISFLLIAALVSALAISCSDKAVEADTTMSESTAEETTISDADKRAAIPDNLPEADYGGYSFRILTRSNSMAFCAHLEDLYAEEVNGDVINDAVYKRNTTVEDRFNFKIKPIVIDASDESKPVATFKRSVMSGGDDYDMIIDHMIYMGTAVFSQVFYNWYDVPNIDFEKPWWISDATNKLKIDGKSFFALSDLSFNTLDYTYCMFFNKRILSDYGIDLPYQTVRDHKWTIDYLISITKDVYQDLNGDQTADDEDLYGFVSNAYSATVTYTYSFDDPVTTPDSDGNPQLVINNEKTQSIVEKMYDFYNNYNGVNVMLATATKSGKSWIDYAADMFTSGNAMIITGMFVNAKMQFRNIEDDYGVLPYPLWDENQENYYTMLDGHGPMMGIPITVTDTSRTGTIIEAMSAEGYKIVTPAYYDVALKTKFARDEESAEMIDLVLAGRTFDFGYMYDGWNGMAFYLQTMMAAKNTNFASFYASNEKKVLKYYDRVVESYKEYNQ